MEKKSKSIKRNSDILSRKAKADIQPFAEQPAGDIISKSGKEKGDLPASELFSLFTANIIRENKPFTR